MNSQNNRIWSSGNPHGQKIGVWCAVSRCQIVGPIFFLNVYQDIITQFIAILEDDERECWLHQDGATCHTPNETKQFLCEFFGDCLILKGLWPQRSPDLSPADFFLWG
ncbi:hypothetical protein B7P43_G12790 [Cryptotermes secundus]|uniref:Tc1-like transposase DDE domain-containing protein n=1 Tax=Cryptotermes secundus TaxID=105785 RepID=A0A2J7QGK4_9NEOP|nr:hypothetical protein B7P43_G12790 [Cryptotermes secundus]